MEVRQSHISAIKILDSEVITAGQTHLATPIDLRSYASVGFFTLQIKVESTGSVNVDYLSSNDIDSSRVYLKPESSSNIYTGVSATSGISGDGNLIDSYNAIASIFHQLRFEETSGVNPVTVTAWLTIVGKD